MSVVWDGGGEEDLCHVRSGGHSLTYVPSGECWRRGGALACTQWGMLSDTCPQWGMVEERRICVMYAVGTLTHICSQWGMMEERKICVMYAVGDTHSHMFPVGDDGGEENL